MGKIMQSRPVDMGEVVEYHANPRRGDVEVIKASLEAHGQYRPIVVNVGTKAEHQMEILAGNHTFRAAKELGWEQIDAVLVDVDDDEAARIVLVDNRSSDLAENDGQALADLLRSLPELDGTGYEPPDLDALLESLQPAPGSAGLMPEGDDNYDGAQFGVTVVVGSEPEQEDLYNRLTGEGYKDVRVVTV